jgi:hypothetical protein
MLADRGEIADLETVRFPMADLVGQREGFDLIDPTEPEDWITEFGEDGERYSYPTPLNEAGFFEGFFDRKPEQTSVFWRVVNQKLAHAA